jgi:acetolactate synthase-1/2/3 large subunit
LAQAEMAQSGARALVDALVDRGVERFIMNPGTSEVHLVAAIDANARAQATLCLFEGVATGVADGFARATGKPAAVLLHLGPGLANGLANLHNAKKARSPMIVVVGEHATTHLRLESPLSSDLQSLAGYAAKRVFHLHPGDDIAAVVGDAIEAATARPAGPVVVVSNADTMWSRARQGSFAAAAPAAPAVPKDLVDAAAAQLRARERCLLFVGGEALSAEGARLAAAIANAAGADVLSETFNACQERGAGIPPIARLPYFREAAVERLSRYDTIVLVGSRQPVAFFASPEQPSELAAAGARMLFVPEELSSIAFLQALARALGAAAVADAPQRLRADCPQGSLTPAAVWASLNRLMPAGAIVSDEAGVSSVGADQAMAAAEPHRWMNLTGGSIGQAVPVATGAALAERGATVFAMQGDGGGMYTMQALWTQARERLRVVNVIFRNERYAILDYEVKRHGLAPLGPKGSAMFDLTDPSIDWLALARSMGVAAFSADSAEDFDAALEAAIGADGPCLIEARMSRGRSQKRA